MLFVIITLRSASAAFPQSTPQLSAAVCISIDATAECGPCTARSLSVGSLDLSTPRGPCLLVAAPHQPCHGCAAAPWCPCWQPRYPPVARRPVPRVGSLRASRPGPPDRAARTTAPPDRAGRPGKTDRAIRLANSVLRNMLRGCNRLCGPSKERARLVSTHCAVQMRTILSTGGRGLCGQCFVFGTMLQASDKFLI